MSWGSLFGETASWHHGYHLNPKPKTLNPKHGSVSFPRQIVDPSDFILTALKPLTPHPHRPARNQKLLGVGRAPGHVPNKGYVGVMFPKTYWGLRIMGV